MPINFREMLKPESVFVNVDAGSKKHALQMLSGHLARDQAVVTADDIFEALLERERLGCTAGEFGLAIPHARLPGIDAPYAVILRLSNSIDFDSGANPDVDLIFGMIAPERSDEEDAKRFSAMASRLTAMDVTERLRRAHDERAIYDLLMALDDPNARKHTETLPFAADG
ncbi:MAG: PTS sugar transporter subunit IIA [Pseudomonadota bacterium]